MDKVSEFFARKMELNVWIFWLMLIALVGNMGMDAYEYFTWTRPLERCMDERLYRCDIGHTRIFITYDGDAGPDE